MKLYLLGEELNNRKKFSLQDFNVVNNQKSFGKNIMEKDRWKELSICEGGVRWLFGLMIIWKKSWRQSHGTWIIIASQMNMVANFRSSILCSIVKDKEKEKKRNSIVGYWHMAKVWGNVKDLLKVSTLDLYTVLKYELKIYVWEHVWELLGPYWL